MTEVKVKGPWTDAEIDAGIGMYFAMRAGVHVGAKLNKRSIIREFQANGLERSRGSIEAKLMNITACLEYLGRTDLSMSEHGYRPLANYQRALLDRVKVLAETADLDEIAGILYEAADAVA